MFRSFRRALKRELVRRIALVIIASMIALAPALVGGLQASAESGYDDLWRTTNDLYFGIEEGNPFGPCEIKNHKSDWLTTALDANWNWDEDKKASLQSAIDNDGRWAVSQNNIEHVATGTFMYTYTIHWTEDDTMELDWDLYDDQITAVRTQNNTLYTAFSVDIVPSGSNCDYRGDFASGRAVSNRERPYGPTNTHTDTFNFYLWISEQNRNIPPGYNGDPVENTPIGSGKETYYPTISATVTDKTIILKLDEPPFEPCSVSYMLSYSEKNNNDYGETIIETLKNGWLQIIRGDITLSQWRTGEDNYDTEVLDFKYKVSANNEVIIDVPDYGSLLVMTNVHTEWEGAPRVACGDNGNPDDFEYDVRPRLQFINVDGTNYILDGTKCDPESRLCDTTTAKSDLMDCFTATFPFFDMPACKDAIGVFIKRLSFGAFQFGNSWVHDTQCRELVVLGHWIGANSNVVCPYFPSYVRNIIDPFVTFILALGVVTFIALRTGKDF